MARQTSTTLPVEFTLCKQIRIILLLQLSVLGGCRELLKPPDFKAVVYHLPYGTLPVKKIFDFSHFPEIVRFPPYKQANLARKP